MSEEEQSGIAPILSERQATEQVLRLFDLWDAVKKLCSDYASAPAWKLRQYMIAVVQAKTASFSPNNAARFKVSSCIADMINAEIDKLAPRDSLPPKYGRAKTAAKKVDGRLQLPDATLYSGGVSNGAGKAVVAQRQRVLNKLTGVDKLLREFKRGGLIGVGGTAGRTAGEEQQQGKDNQAV